MNRNHWPLVILSLMALAPFGWGCSSMCCRAPIANESVASSGQVRRISKSTGRYEIEVAYPRSRFAFMDDAIDSFVDESVGSFIQAAEANPTVPWPSKMILTCTTAVSGNFTCYKCDNYVYTGGAHGNTTVRTFVFDRTWRRQLAPAEIFRDEPRTWRTVSALVTQRLRTSLGEFASEDQINAGAGPVRENFEDFVIAGDSVIFFFEHYKVAAYAAGQQRATISMRELDSVLLPAFRPSDQDVAGDQQLRQSVISGGQ